MVYFFIESSVAPARLRLEFREVRFLARPMAISISLSCFCLILDPSISRMGRFSDTRRVDFSAMLIGGACALALHGLVEDFATALRATGFPPGEESTWTSCAPALGVGYFHIYVGTSDRRGAGRCSSIFLN